MLPIFVALVWAAVLLPPLIRKHMNREPEDSVSEFRRNLRVLETAAPAASSLSTMAGSVESHSRTGVSHSLPIAWARQARKVEIARRRRLVSKVLLGVCGATLVVGLLPQMHWVLALHVVADCMLGAYVHLLAKHRAQMRLHLREMQLAEQEERQAARVALYAMHAENAVGAQLK